ncbi:MAG: hypothetical protein FJ267_11495, partial [Planctomycetes bacterium]|nr:hypothetical protein [Planctomycetota bacterium]
MAKVLIECSGCLTKLNLPDASKLGKKIRCPKCQTVFLAERFEDDDNEDLVEAVGDDDEDEVELEDYDDEPKSKKQPVRTRNRGGNTKTAQPSATATRGSQRSKTGRKSNKKSESSSKGLLIGGGIAGIIVLIGGGLFLSGAFSESGNASNTPSPNLDSAAGSSESAPSPSVASATPSTTPAASPATTPPAPGTNDAPATPTSPASTPVALSTSNSATVPPTASVPSPAQTKLSKTLELKWFPENVEMIFQIKVSELTKAALLKGLFESPQAKKQFGDIQKQLGINPTDIETITMGSSDIKSMSSPSLPGGFPGQSPVTPPGPWRGTIVLRTSKPVLHSAILKDAPELKAIQHSGRSLFQFPPPKFPISGLPGQPMDLPPNPTTAPTSNPTTRPTSNPMTRPTTIATSPNLPDGTTTQGAPIQSPVEFGGWVADENTVLIGPIKELRDTIDRGETTKTRADYGFADSSTHILIAVLPVNPVEFFKK